MEFTTEPTIFDYVNQHFEIDNKVQSLFKDIKDIKLSEELKYWLTTIKTFTLASEKAKSEFIIAPLLVELYRRNNGFFTLYSGEELLVEGHTELTSICDFILSADTESYAMNLPVMIIRQAPEHDMSLGVYQCAGQMVGAKIFNERNGDDVKVIYGCVTNGDNWRFMRLKDNTIVADSTTYYLSQLPTILGVFQEIIDYYKSVLGEAKKTQ